MRMLPQLTEKNLKQLGVAALLAGGLCAHAFAQAPSLSSLPQLPPLAQLPKVPQASVPAAPASPAAPAVNLSDHQKSETLSPLPAMPTAKPDEKKIDPALIANPLADLPPPQADSSEGAPPSAPLPTATPAPTAETAPLPLPAIPTIGTALPTPVVPSLPSAGQESATLLPQIRVVRDKPKPKTWQTQLVQQVIPPKTNFRYRRVVLPGTIYRDAYDRDNSHLPLRETREQYEALLFNSVAKNDVEGTRALLNAGTSLNAINAYGETPRMMAERIGAFEVAALLSARGAH